MKKKIALLLAVIMVVSMMPMHLFGAPAGFTPVPAQRTRGTVSNPLTGMNQHRDLAIQLNIAEFIGANLPGNDMRIPLTVRTSDARIGPGAWSNYGHDPGRTITVPIIGGNSVTSGASVRITVQRSVNGVGISSTSGWFTSEAEVFVEYLPYEGAEPTAVPSGAGGHFTFYLGAWVPDEAFWVNAFMNIWLGSPYDLDAVHNVLFSGSITSVQEYSIAISAGPGAPRGFSSALHVPDIVLRESRAGAIRNIGSNAGAAANVGIPTLVRLEAPQFYSWALEPFNGAGAFTHPSVTVVNSPQHAGLPVHGLPLGAGRPGEVRPFAVQSERAVLIVPGAGSARSDVSRVDPANGLIQVGDVTVTHTWTGGSQVDGVSIARDASSRHVLWIEIPVVNRQGQVLPDALLLRNLWLVPDDRAQNVADVNIDVQRGWGTVTAANAASPVTGWQWATGWDTGDTHLGQPVVVGTPPGLPEPAPDAPRHPGTWQPLTWDRLRNWEVLRAETREALVAAFGANPANEWDFFAAAQNAVTNVGSAAHNAKRMLSEDISGAAIGDNANYFQFGIRGFVGGTGAAFSWSDPAGTGFVTRHDGGAPTSTILRRIPDVVGPGSSHTLEAYIPGALLTPPVVPPAISGWMYIQTGEVSVGTTVGWHVQGDGTTLRGDINFPQGHGGVRGTGWRQTLLVGRRGNTGLDVSVHEGPNDIRTGWLGDRRTGVPVNVIDATRTRNVLMETYANQGRPNDGITDGWYNYNRDNVQAPHYRGVMTSTLIIEETIANSFGHGHGNPINFEFLYEEADGRVIPHPGIRVLGVQARAGNDQPGHTWQRGVFNNFPAFPAGIVRPDEPDNHNLENRNQNWMTFMGFVSAVDQSYPNVSGVGRVHPHGVTLYLPGQNITDVRQEGILEVRFFLSIEAGYEWKYGPEVDVTISGNGVANLLGTCRYGLLGGHECNHDCSYTVTIAYARDPISVRDIAITEVEVGTLYNVGRVSLPDVYIEVHDNDRFEIGSEIWLYIATGNMARSNDLQIESARISFINDRYPFNESGLRLDQTRRLHHPRGNFWLDGIAYTVSRQPYANSSPVIRIEDIVVSGQVFPDTNYYLVVSGTHIAQNDQEVRAARLPGTVGAYPWYLGAHLAAGNVGVFTTLPFNHVIVAHGEGGVGGAIDAPGGAHGQRASFTEHMIVNVDGADIRPIAFTIYGNARVTKMNPRVFANFAGGTTDWNGDTNTATFEGPNWITGEQVTVALTTGQAAASVNGRNVDIATEALQPQFAGQIVPVIVDGRMYVPARFLANMFGVPIDFTGHGANMTIILG
ncbi:MAG: copper amine oxidase N-terminal domain-containing protein [Defluviitaleaceae bacterium]|nr:copper amine oxidase N-terminal domain-containing protein [Defluviitaleaceae bacterium]